MDHHEETILSEYEILDVRQNQISVSFMKGSTIFRDLKVLFLFLYGKISKTKHLMTLTCTIIIKRLNLIIV